MHTPSIDSLMLLEERKMGLEKESRYTRLLGSMFTQHPISFILITSSTSTVALKLFFPLRMKRRRLG
jgi:hypothetical protein